MLIKSRFILHQHKTGRRHFDLRLIHEDALRTWSLLQEPPQRTGQRRLAIERESFPADAMDQSSFNEQAFGEGSVYVWDEGGVEITEISQRHLRLLFRGTKLIGGYRLRRMLWYPGNHWLLEKEAPQRNLA
jgi:DNA ligase D-like protein (predicted 3'-phosphoesterase)